MSAAIGRDAILQIVGTGAWKLLRLPTVSIAVGLGPGGRGSHAAWGVGETWLSAERDILGRGMTIRSVAARALLTGWRKKIVITGIPILSAGGALASAGRPATNCAMAAAGGWLRGWLPFFFE